MDSQLHEVMEQFLKLKSAFGKKDYDGCSDLLILFEKLLSSCLKTLSHTDLDPDFDFFEGLEKQQNPTDAFNPYERLDDHESANEIPENEIAQAEKHANEASKLITRVAIDSSIPLNIESVQHLESCQAQISAAKQALQQVLFHLSQAKAMNQPESLLSLLQ